MALPDLPPKLTYDDYLLFPEDGLRHEILDGEHYVTASPFVRHQRISGRIYRPLSSWVEERDLGEVFYASVDVVLSPHDVAVPDLFYISKERSEIITEKNIQGAPDLIIEIISCPDLRFRFADFLPLDKNWRGFAPLRETLREKQPSRQAYF